MKRFILLLFSILCVPWLARAQTNLTAAAADCNTTSACLSVPVSASSGSATFAIPANVSANTIQFEGAADGTNGGPPTLWVALNVTPSNSTTPVTSATTTGVWQANVAAYTNVRMRMSNLVSGITTVKITQSPASARAPGGAGGGSGTVTSVGLVGTANQITVTGASPITGAGSWTLSIPTSPTIPGTTTGTFSGNLTGNVTGNASGTAATITGSLALANTPLTTTQDILYDNAGALARLPIVTAGSCLGNTAGAWATLACSGGGAGTVTHTAGALTANQVVLGNGAADTVILAAPVPPTNVSDFLCNNGTTSSYCIPGMPIDAQTTCSPFVIPSGDRSSVVTMSNGGACPVTLPNATGDFANNFNTALFNIGAGLVTITPTTATINGNATQIVANHWGSFIYSAGGNYRAMTVPDLAAFPTCSTASSALQFTTATGALGCNTTEAQTGVDINTSNQVTITHIAGGTTNFLSKFNATGNLVPTLCDEAVTTANTITCTNTAGIAAPKFTATGTTAGFVDYPQGTTSAAVAPCNAATSICEQAPAAVTSYLITKPGVAPNIASYKQTDGCAAAACTESYHPVPALLTVTADFTDSTSATLGLITGLSTTLPVSKAVVISFHCALLFDQATAAVSDSFGIGITGTAPTSANASGTVWTSASVGATGTLVSLASTTPTAVVTFTPSAITTVWKAELDGTIEQPSNATPGVFGVYAATTTGADNLIIKRGSYCSVIYQ